MASLVLTDSSQLTSDNQHLVILPRLECTHLRGSNHQRELGSNRCSLLPVAKVRSGTAIRGVGGTVHDVANYIIHENFNENNFDNDIALLQVDTPFQFSASVQPISLPAQGEATPVGTQAVVSGWGVTVNGGTEYSSDLLYITVNIYSDSDCNDKYYADYGGLFVGDFCAGHAEGGIDACQGDSGGPLAAGGKLVGIVSWGDQCALPDRPGVYTRVSYYRDWIKEKTGV
uniref:Peptidase S1 domain-containing protein n=1 Tax=Timema monikensis TaxID=170555 RepID=A0A7R9DY43_9NEOP|nr:unnamed protein product [Timema monikensis]